MSNTVTSEDFVQVNTNQALILEKIELESERLAKLSLLNDKNEKIEMIQKEVELLTISKTQTQLVSNNMSVNNCIRNLQKVWCAYI
jgi:hypothetical protein